MVRAAFFLYLLSLLAAAPASAYPTHTAWFFWLSKPEHHGSRKLAGDFTHINTTYRYHSRERQGLFSFLHSHQPNLARHHQSGKQPTRPARKHTTGLF